VKRRYVLIPLVLLASVAWTGCTGPSVDPTVRVTGQLVRGGKPLAGKKTQVEGTEGYDGYTVSFYNASTNESLGGADVDEQGKFEVEVAPNTKYKVVVVRKVYPESFSGPPPGAAPGQMPNPNAELGKVAELNTTPIVIEIGGSDQDIGQIDLDKYK